MVGLPDSTVIFGGTLAAHGGVRATDKFSFEMEDPILGRKISHICSVMHLSVKGVRVLYSNASNLKNFFISDNPP